MASDLLNRITINPEQCGGRACVRGMRIRVIDVLELFAAGLSSEQILKELPDLEADDLSAALQYAARRPGSSGCPVATPPTPALLKSSEKR